MRQIISRRRHNNRGDTIVEVLICILVISSVLAGAFAVTNQSLLEVQDSQERSQAVKIAETQIERLRGIDLLTATPPEVFCSSDAAPSSATSTTYEDSKTCYFDRNGSYLTAGADGSGFTLSPSGSGDISGLYSSQDGALYKVMVQKKSGSSTADPTYAVSIRWITIKSHLGNLTMYYRPAND